MNYKEVLTAIKNENLSNLYLFWGTEHYLIENTVHHIKEKLIEPAFQDLNYQHIDGRETRVEDIINASETLPFMDSVRLIVIKELECFSGKKKNISEEEEGRLIAYLSQIPKSTHLIFVYTDAIDKRKKIIKEIGKTGHIIEFNKLTEKDAYSWVNKAFQKQKKKVKMEEIKIFLDNSGYLDRNSDKTLKDLENEIIKLINYVGEREMISKEDIQLLASRTIENDIFMLVESIGEKNGEKALRILN
ncbi:MAG: DNA polymerase III subunit delta, partial [Thermotaleaceae bacterium]